VQKGIGCQLLFVLSEEGKSSIQSSFKEETLEEEEEY